MYFNFPKLKYGRLYENDKKQTFKINNITS